MSTTDTTVDLGFAEARVSEGCHVCQLYGNDEERDRALQLFLLRGLANREISACFSDRFSPEQRTDEFRAAGHDLHEALERADLLVRGAEETYFAGGIFDPDRMLQQLAQFHRAARDAGRSVRVIGEMSPRITTIEGGSRLMEYEGRVNGLLRVHPLTAVCQYDVRLFSGSIIMDVLSMHPQVVVQNHLIQNPFFAPPSEYHWHD